MFFYYYYYYYYFFALPSSSPLVGENLFSSFAMLKEINSSMTHYQFWYYTKYWISSTSTQNKETSHSHFMESEKYKLLLTMGEYSQITHFYKLCCNLPLFQKYVTIYHFLGTRVWRNRVFHGTRVPWTWGPWKNFPANLKYNFSKNSSFETRVSRKTQVSQTQVSKRW